MKRIAGLALVYALLATFVLRLFAENGIVSVVWPPSGLALAALIVGGRRVALGVWLGAWVANMMAGSSPLVAAAIATGNALEAIVGHWLIGWRGGFNPALDRLRDLIRLLVAGAGMASIVAALIGSGTLWAAGIIAPELWQINFLQWWMGDALGVALMTPLLLVWRRAPHWHARGLWMEAALVLALMGLVGQVVFDGWHNETLGVFARGYWFFLFNIWAAIRFGSHGVTVLLMVVAVQGIWGAASNVGYFSGPSTAFRMTAYWGYMIVMSFEGLTLTIYTEELRRIKEHLQASKQKLRTVLDFSSNPIFIATSNDRFSYANRAAQSLLGYDPQALMAMDLRDTVSPQDAERVMASWHQAGGSQGPLEAVFLRKDGTPVVVEFNKVNLPDGTVLGEMRDVTQMRQDSQRIRMLSLLVEQSANFIDITNEQGEISYVNAAFTQAMGYTLDELKGKPPSVLLCADTPASTYAGMWQALKAGRTWRGEVHRLTKQGEKRIVRQSVFPLRERDLVSYYVTIAEDVTAMHMITAELDQHRRHLEAMVCARTAELATQTRRTRAVLDSMADGVILINSQGLIIEVNISMTRLFGFPPCELLGHNLCKLMPDPHGEQHDSYLQRYLQSKRAGQMSEVVDHRRQVSAMRSDGTLFPLEIAVTALTDERGTTFVGILRDLSQEQKTAQARELAQAEAGRLAQARTHFMANMSHEIRTPLGAVLGLARIGHRDGPAGAAHDACTGILEAGNHLLAVVNDILDFSKIEAGKMVLESRPFALAALLDETLALMAQRAGARGLALQGTLAPDLPAWVLGDSMRIKQILLNLLSNAVKFTERGSISLALRGRGGLVEFAVRDDGIGMPPEQVARLFRPFEQADASTTRRYGGTGLGLTISMNLAQMMGGTIDIISAPGQGSTFSLTLPLPLAPAQPPAQEGGDAAVAAPASEGQRLSGLRILVAEDDPVNRMLLADLLHSEGASALFAENGRAAVAQVAAQAQALDLVLMDVQMPEMDGYEATRRVRAIEPDLPVVGLTAHAMKEARDRCLASGMVAHLTKPVSPDELVAAARHAASLRAPAPSAIGLKRFSEVNWAALHQRLRGKTALIVRVVNAALEEHAHTPDELRGLARQGDLSGLATLAHKVRGLGANLAAPGVQTLASALEAAAVKREAKAIDTALQLSERTDLLLDELRTYAYRP